MASDAHKVSINMIYGKPLYPDVWEKIDWNNFKQFRMEPSDLFEGAVNVYIGHVPVLLDMMPTVLVWSGFPEKFCKEARKVGRVKKKPKLKRRVVKLKRRA
jgi:hypothetical protein